jgi:hypothetical protein
MTPWQGKADSRGAFSGGLPGAESDYNHLTIDQFTSTPHQPANACFAPSLLPNVAENGPLQGWKMRKIKGLACK